MILRACVHSCVCLCVCLCVCASVCVCVFVSVCHKFQGISLVELLRILSSSWMSLSRVGLTVKSRVYTNIWHSIQRNRSGLLA